MNCKDIRIGMTFGQNGERFSIVKEGSHLSQYGQRLQLDNRRKNKWYARRIGSEDKAELFCFDEQFDNQKQYHFA